MSRDIYDTLVVDFGTSNSCMAYWDGQFPCFIPSENRSNNLFPTCVEINSNGFTVGDIARRHIGKPNVIYELKRIIGRSYSDKVTEACLKNWPFTITKDEFTDSPLILIPNPEGGDWKYTINELYEGIIASFKAIAEEATNKYFKNVIVTIPAYFNNLQKEATKECFGMNFESVDFILEPNAAALAYCIENGIKDGTIFVFDLGGGTFDVTILSVKNQNFFEIKGTGGDGKLGGMDFTNCLATVIKRKIREYNDAYDPELYKAKIHSKAESIKILLSEPECSCVDFNLDEIDEDLDGYITITRDEFNIECQDLFKKCRNAIHQSLVNAMMTTKDIDYVVMIGGSSRIWVIDSVLGELFGREKIRKNINPDEAVAKGGMYYAASKCGIEVKPQPTYESVMSCPRPPMSVVTTPEPPVGVKSIDVSHSSVPVEVKPINEEHSLHPDEVEPINEEHLLHLDEVEPINTSLPPLPFELEAIPSTHILPSSSVDIKPINVSLPPLPNDMKQIPPLPPVPPIPGQSVILDQIPLNLDGIQQESIQQSTPYATTLDGPQFELFEMPPSCLFSLPSGTVKGEQEEKSERITICFKDKLRKSFVMEQADNSSFFLLAKDESIPAEREYLLETLEDFASSVYINIAEGNDHFFSENDLYAKIEISDIPKRPKGEVKVVLKIRVDENSMAHFSAYTMDYEQREAVVTLIKPQSLRESFTSYSVPDHLRPVNAMNEQCRFENQLRIFSEKIREQTNHPNYPQLKLVEETMSHRSFERDHSFEEYRRWQVEMVEELQKIGYRREDVVV